MYWTPELERELARVSRQIRRAQAMRQQPFDPNLPPLMRDRLIIDSGEPENAHGWAERAHALTRLAMRSDRLGRLTALSLARIALERARG
jgi:hypothetical protein